MDSYEDNLIIINFTFQFKVIERIIASQYKH